MSDCFILLSAGKSKRFKSKHYKQFITYKNKPLYEHSLKTAIDSKMFKKTSGFTVLSLKNVKTPLVLLCFRSNMLKNHVFYFVFAQKC